MFYLSDNHSFISKYSVVFEWCCFVKTGGSLFLFYRYLEYILSLFLQDHIENYFNLKVKTRYAFMHDIIMILKSQFENNR